MICHFALIIALLCFKPSRGALLNDFRITKTAAGHDPLLNAQNIVNVDLMSEQASREIHESYLKSQKRLILLDDDGTLKPFMDENSWHDQWRIKRALKKLSADPMNEVWIITDSDVGVLKKAYGHIRGLHLAGYKGTQLDRESARGLILPQPGPIAELRAQADRIFAENGVTPPAPDVSRQQYVIEYVVPITSSEGNSEWGKVREMQKLLQALIESSEKYRGYTVEVDIMPTEPMEYRVVVENPEHYNKGTLAKALFKKQEEVNRPFQFGLSIGNMEPDEPMHQAMRERSHHAIIVKATYDNSFFTWPTYASHRLQDYRKSIDLLEELAGTRNWANGLWHRVLQSFSGVGQEIQLLFEKLKGLRRYSKVSDA